LPVGIVIGCRLLPSGLADRVGSGEAAGVRRVGLRWARLNGWRSLRSAPVEMPERQHKLNRQREESEPRPVFDVRSKPLHADRRPASQEAKAFSAALML
jgi:hypothetical protein